MITKLGLENFRVFQNKAEFNFAPISILTGTNSCGKSSILKAIELLGVNFQTKGKFNANIFEELQFNTEKVKLKDL